MTHNHGARVDGLDGEPTMGELQSCALRATAGVRPVGHAEQPFAIKRDLLSAHAQKRRPISHVGVEILHVQAIGIGWTRATGQVATVTLRVTTFNENTCERGGAPSKQEVRVKRHARLRMIVVERANIERPERFFAPTRLSSHGERERPSMGEWNILEGIAPALRGRGRSRRCRRSRCRRLRRLCQRRLCRDQQQQPHPPNPCRASCVRREVSVRRSSRRHRACRPFNVGVALAVRNVAGGVAFTERGWMSLMRAEEPAHSSRCSPPVLADTAPTRTSRTRSSRRALDAAGCDRQRTHGRTGRRRLAWRAVLRDHTPGR